MLYANPYVEALNFGDADGCLRGDRPYAFRCRDGAGGVRGAIALPRRRRSRQPWRRWTWPTARSSRARIRTAACVPEASAKCGPSMRSNATSSIRRPRKVPRPCSTRSVPRCCSRRGNRQARMQFLTAIVEQLLVDNKRARDTEAAAMNMQLGRLRRWAKGWPWSSRRRRRRPAQLAAAVEGFDHASSTATRHRRDDAASDHDAADDLRTGIPPRWVLAVRGVRDDPDGVAGHPDDARPATRWAITCSTLRSCCCSSRSATP